MDLRTTIKGVKMKITTNTVYLENGEKVTENFEEIAKKYSEADIAQAEKGAICDGILDTHNIGDEKKLKIKFDALASHDITYVGIIQTARASGLTKFPVPYVLTNCHNSLCAVGGTINEDDHVFGLSSAKKYGGIFVPPHVAVIHQYMREMFASCGKMILGSDSHTRYGALGTLAIGEGGPELVKQILSRTYDIDRPKKIAVVLTGETKRGVGPQDVALKLIGEVFKGGLVKNAILEFVGSGINAMSMDFRIGVDVMTTETACLSSIWATDNKTEEYLANVGRQSDYKKLEPKKLAKYDGSIEINLSEIVPMIAMPFHPSNTYEIQEVVKNPIDILREAEKIAVLSMGNKDLTLDLTSKVKDGKIYVEQGIIAGCAGGTYENITEASEILKGGSIGNGEFSLSVYPSSIQVYQALTKSGAFSELINSGAVIKTAFCGPCFGAGDVPSNKAFSIRHTTRNFPSREGSKPNQNQIASVALMDARSIASTAKNGGVLTPATEVDYDNSIPKYTFEKSIYGNRVYDGFGKADENAELKFGPNIQPWPQIEKLGQNVLLKIASVINDEVTTTDELIPSGETSSYRSNPLKLAEFTLSRKDPKYVARAKEIQNLAKNNSVEIEKVLNLFNVSKDNTQIASVIFANKPGDGSAREQAASCQRVLGGGANIAKEYATKRYRSNLINWGMLPLITKENIFDIGDYVFVENIRNAIESGQYEIKAKLIKGENVSDIMLYMDNLTDEEKKIVLAGCLMNYYNE